MGLSARSLATVLADRGDPRHGTATDWQIAGRVGVWRRRTS